MIVDLPDTTVSAISKQLVNLRDEGGVVALGRVLTLIISTDSANADDAISAANSASREHPMRVIVIVSNGDDEHDGLDAEIRIGSDAGASEIIVMRAHGAVSDDEEGLVTGLLLSDAPTVVWWTGVAPTVPSQSPLGRIAQRRITDASAQPNPASALRALSESYTPGDTDFAWTRLTLWRGQLAAVLDQPPYEPVDSVSVHGAASSPSTLLLAAWLRMQLQADTEYALDPEDGEIGGIHGVVMTRASGSIDLHRTTPLIASLTQPEQPDHDISLPRRSLRDCLAEELRRLDPDEAFGAVITRGLPQLVSASESASSLVTGS